jgi:hypothetical protein
MGSPLTCCRSALLEELPPHHAHRVEGLFESFGGGAPLRIQGNLCEHRGAMLTGFDPVEANRAWECSRGGAESGDEEDL